MLRVFQSLLRLYPAEHRDQFGEEMTAVFSDRCAEHEGRSPLARTAFSIHEICGLIGGAVIEHVSAVVGRHTGFAFPRRFTVRNGFRFPRTTALLMTIILAGVIIAIKKGEDIAASLPHVNPQIGPIQPMPSTLLPPIIVFFAFFYAAGLIGWIILFALRRSGVHRIAEMSGQQK